VLFALLKAIWTPKNACFLSESNKLGKLQWIQIVNMSQSQFVESCLLWKDQQIITHIIVQLTSQLNAESVLEDHLKNLCTYRPLQLQSSTNWPPNTKLYDMPFLPCCWQLKYNLPHYYSITKSLDLTFNAEGNLWPPATSFPSLGYNYLNSLSSGIATLNYIMHFQSKLLETVQ
jgi:hypothetical protein